MSDNDKLKQLDDVAAYEAELENEKEEKTSGKQEKYVRTQTVKQQPQAAEKPKKDKKKAPGRFKRFWIGFGKKFRDMFLELKKVSWPSFPKVMKQTGIVVAVVLFFLIVIFAFDLGLSQLWKGLMDAISS